MNRLQQKAALIDAIADFATSEMGRKSIQLEMGKPDAAAWAKIRSAIGGSCWTKEEAIAALNELLG